MTDEYNTGARGRASYWMDRAQRAEAALRNVQSVCMDEVMHNYEKVKQIDSMCDNALATPPPEVEPHTDGGDMDRLEYRRSLGLSRPGNAHPTPEQTGSESMTPEQRFRREEGRALSDDIQKHGLGKMRSLLDTRRPTSNDPKQAGDALAAFDRLCNWYSVPGDDDIRDPDAAKSDVEIVRQALTASGVPDDRPLCSRMECQYDEACIASVDGTHCPVASGVPYVPYEIKCLPERFRSIARKCQEVGANSKAEAFWSASTHTLEALASAPAVPEGYKLVPVEPTDRMIGELITSTATDQYTNENRGEIMRSNYRRMIAAAPQREDSAAPCNCQKSGYTGPWPCPACGNNPCEGSLPDAPKNGGK